MGCQLTLFYVRQCILAILVLGAWCMVMSPLKRSLMSLRLEDAVQILLIRNCYIWWRGPQRYHHQKVLFLS